jgi:hypothetical protein
VQNISSIFLFWLSSLKFSSHENHAKGIAFHPSMNEATPNDGVP